MKNFFVCIFKNSGYEAVAQFGFIVLFPGYVIYHYGVVAGWFPAFAGGLFGSAAMVVSLFGLTYVLGILISRVSSVPFLEYAFLLLLGYMLVWTVGAVVVADRTYEITAVTGSFSTIVIWIAVYFIGVHMRLPMHGPGWVLVSLGVAVLACFVHAIVMHDSFLGPFLMFSGAQGDASTYQGIGRAVVVLAVVLAYLQRRFSGQLTVLAGALIVLLALGSRAHLFATVFLLIVHVVLFGFRGRNLFTNLAAIVAFLMVGYFAASVFLETRAAEIFDLTLSSSWNARQEALQEALRVIESNPFFGNFGYYLGESTGYAHNIISAWTEYGIVGFLLFIALMLYALGVSGYRVLFRRSCPPVWIIAFQFNLVAFFLALTSEPILASVFPALGWGFTVQAFRTDRKGQTFLRPPLDRRPSISHVSVR